MTEQEKVLPSFSRFVDATLIISIATALIYFLNVLYLTNLYSVFGIDTPSAALPDTLVACPYLGLVILMLAAAAFRGVERKNGDKRAVWVFSLAHSVMGVLTVSIAFLIISAFCFGRAEGKDKLLKANEWRVSFYLDKQRIEDYSLLTKADGYFYFFKPMKSALPAVKIVATSEVHDLTLRPESPSFEPVVPAPAPK